MPRAKKSTVKKKETVKKTTVKKKEPTIEEIVKKQVEEQLQEALLNIEIEPSKTTEIDIASIRAEIRAEVQNEFNAKVKKLESIQKGETQALNMSNSLITVESSLDGISVRRTGTKDDAFSLSKSGAFAFGNRVPRTVGLGTAHFRMKGAGKSPIPTNGPGSTRGVIIESDGDDDNVFIFRALSTGNRQGLNITGTGKVGIGTNKLDTDGCVTIFNNKNDINGLTVLAKSKYFSDSVLSLENTSDIRETYNFIDAKGNKGQDTENSYFRVNGKGETFTHKGFYSNSSGYAELFEWADGNTKEEDRVGLTVALNSEGKLIDASDDNEQIIGVVVDSAAIIGNTGWNMWQGKPDDRDNDYKKYKIVEWLDDSGVLHSEYIASLSKEFAFPENAIIYETEHDGSDLQRPLLSASFDASRDYTPRLKRGWTLVAIKGTVNLFKGQNIRSSWIKIRDLDDELEQRILL